MYRRISEHEIGGHAKVPIYSWCPNADPDTMQQAYNLARHPTIILPVVLMPDAHVGFGMPIGGVAACDNAIIPNAVGVDIGCGMAALKTDCPSDTLSKEKLKKIIETLKKKIPVGEGHSHSHPQSWSEYDRFCDQLKKTPGWLTPRGEKLDKMNLGTLGGGNHFLELQCAESDQLLWVMLHSGSRNLGNRIATWYHQKALELDNKKLKVSLPSQELAFLPMNTEEGREYFRDMQFALRYAAENRRRMIQVVKEVLSDLIPNLHFLDEITIHHNFAAEEEHHGYQVIVHRKGATQAFLHQKGIIPGSMGTASYIVEGLGCPESLQSCSHGAGRRLGRNEACRLLSLEECEKAMKDVVHLAWPKGGRHAKKGHSQWDLSEAPQAYKDIDQVINAQSDLIIVKERLRPLAVLKG